MDIGLMMIFASYGWDNIADDQVWDEDLRLARQAPVLGFDALWSAEHHFFDYSFSFRFGGIPYDKAEASLRLFGIGAPANRGRRYQPCFARAAVFFSCPARTRGRWRKRGLCLPTG
jgi:alkanesulfonate monooxygenase SsuD/methylene tetrahydromethanopterin reductase-like flavin-dependent oxidoreductase (luciferase family)